MDNKCEVCAEKCPQAERAHQAALGRMYATKEFVTLLKKVDSGELVEVVHGRWIDDGGLDEDGNGQYRCSQCGVGEKHNPTVTVSYCWNCGAKMG